MHVESRVPLCANECVEALPRRGRRVDRALDEGWDIGGCIQFGRFVESVAFPGRLGDPAGEVVDAGIVGVEVVCVVVVEEELSQRRIGQSFGLVVKQSDRVVRVSGEHEDPQVALQVRPTRGESPAGQVLQIGTDLGRQRCQTPGGKLAQAPLRCPQTTDAVGELVFDLTQRLPELLVGR